MGSSQSSETRKISIPNDGIRVSDAVLERLNNRSDPKKENENQQKEKGMGEGLSADKDNVRKPLRSHNTPDGGDANLNYYYGPSLTSLKILQEKEEELRETDKYWSKRIQKLEENHANLSNVLEKEYHKAVKEVKHTLPRAKEGSSQLCTESKKKVVDCYKRNPGAALLCAGEVTAFAQCIDSKRIR